MFWGWGWEVDDNKQRSERRGITERGPAISMKQIACKTLAKHIGTVIIMQIG